MSARQIHKASVTQQTGRVSPAETTSDLHYIPWIKLKVRGQLHDKLPRAVQELQEDGAALIFLARRQSPRHPVRMPEVERVSER